MVDSLKNEIKKQNIHVDFFTNLAFYSIIIGIVCAANAAQENRYYGDYYVTISGQKYHTKECFTISGSESAHRITKAEHESGQYSSCSICLPNN